MRRHTTKGMGEIVGSIGALLILVFLLTGTLSVLRVWQAHQTLERAASAAIRSEEQYGCWTINTDQAVTQIVNGSGLVATGIRVLQYTANPATYGNAVTATLQYQFDTNFLFGGITSHTLTTAQNGSSFYVPSSLTKNTQSCTTPVFQ